jgi:hypothetical protein
LATPLNARVVRQTIVSVEDTRKAELKAFCLELLRFLEPQAADASLDEVGRVIDECSSLKGLNTIAGDLLE